MTPNFKGGGGGAAACSGGDDGQSAMTWHFSSKGGVYAPRIPHTVP